MLQDDRQKTQITSMHRPFVDGLHKNTIGVCEHEAHRINAVPLFCGVAVGKAHALPTEDVTHMTITVGTEDLTASAILITLLVDIALHVRPEPWPPAATVKLHLARVHGRLHSSGKARTAEVDARLEDVIKSERGLGGVSWLRLFQSQDLVLVGRQLRLPLRV